MKRAFGCMTLLLLFAIFISAGLWLVSAAFYAMHVWKEQVETANQVREFYQLNCLSPELKSKTGQHDQCQHANHVLRESIFQLTQERVMREYARFFCGESGCVGIGFAASMVMLFLCSLLYLFGKNADSLRKSESQRVIRNKNLTESLHGMP